MFGDVAYKMPVSSSKSMIGHLIAAAGAVELIIGVEALRAAFCRRPSTTKSPTPSATSITSPTWPAKSGVRHALSNSFGFGGQNISLVVSRFGSNQ